MVCGASYLIDFQYDVMRVSVVSDDPSLELPAIVGDVHRLSGNQVDLTHRFETGAANVLSQELSRPERHKNAIIRYFDVTRSHRQKTIMNQH